MYVYFYSLHVSGSHVPIIRRTDCIKYDIWYIYIILFYFFFVALRPNAGHGLLILEVF